MKLSQRLKSSTVVVLVGAGMLLGGASGGLAQSPAPAKPAATATTPAPSDSDKKVGSEKKADKKAVSKECSDQASAKGLHGKERKAFRAECKKNGGKPT